MGSDRGADRRAAGTGGWSANGRPSCWWRRGDSAGRHLPSIVTVCDQGDSTPEGSTMPDSAPVQGTLMQGKRGLIMGVTNDRSLGWGIAAACAAQGAELAFTYQVEALGRRVRPLAASVGVGGSAVHVRRGRRGQHRRGVRGAARTVGGPGFPGPCDRVRRQDLSAGPLPRHATGGLPAGAGYLLLLVRRRRATGGADDATRRQPADAELCRRGTLDATLQRDGRGEGGAGSVGALPGCRPGRRGITGERDQRGADHGRWPRRGLGTSTTSCAGTS